MKCPKYNDFTRECHDYVEVMPSATLDICGTELYTNCPFYIMLEKKLPVCENIAACVAFSNFKQGDFKKFSDIAKQYCLSDNRVNCKRYIVKKTGQKVPETLHPDGRTIAEWGKKV